MRKIPKKRVHEFIKTHSDGQIEIEQYNSECVLEDSYFIDISINVKIIGIDSTYITGVITEYYDDRITSLIIYTAPHHIPMEHFK